MVNSSIITSTCGGSITENMGAAGVFTFLPWVLIFGVLILVLTIYPGFKSAFSDVIGYFFSCFVYSVYNSYRRIFISVRFTIRAI